MSVAFPTAFLSGAPGAGEMILIFAVILLLFGPKRLPEIARMIGRTLDELRKASQDFKDQIMAIDEDAPDTSTNSGTGGALESGEYTGEGVDYGEDWNGTSPDDDYYGNEYGYEEPPDPGDGFTAPEDAAIPDEGIDGDVATDETVAGDDATPGEPVTPAAPSDMAQKEDKHDLAG